MIFWLLISVLFCRAGIYKHVDEEGKVLYTDSGSFEEKLSIPESQYATRPLSLIKSGGAHAYHIHIQKPANGTTISTHINTLILKVAIKPKLRSGDLLQLWHNQEPLGNPQRKQRFDILDLPRGEHHFAVSIVSKDKVTYAKSDSIVIYQQRAFVNFPKQKSDP